MASETNRERLERIKEKVKRNMNFFFLLTGKTGRGAMFLKDAHTELNWLIEQIAEQNTEINRLREALEFYADKESYAVNITEQWEPVFPVLRDDGRIARQALAGEPDD